MAFNLGAQEATTNKNKFLTLRTGKLCESSKEEKPGFKAAFTENKSGKRTDFFAKEYDSIVAYLSDLRWDTKEFDDGAKVSGWKLTLDTGDPDAGFILTVTDKERPFSRLMSVLTNCDFTQPIKFSAFKGRDGNKVLCLYQSDAPEAKPVQAKYASKWLSQTLLQKLRTKAALTPEDKEHLAYDEDGKILGRMKYDEVEGTLSSEGYPYIVETADGKWDSQTWTAFLKQKIEEDVIPAIKAAAAQRLKEGAKHLATTAPKSAPDDPFDDAPNDVSEPELEDLPF